MSHVERFIEENLIDLINEQDRCVELSNAQENDLALSHVLEFGDLIEWISDDLSFQELREFEADIARAFIGYLSHDEFFIKWAASWDKAKRAIAEYYDDKIWNRYCDVYNPPPLDHYAEYGLKRSDF